MKWLAVLIAFSMYYPAFVFGQPGRASLPQNCTKISWAGWSNFTGRSATGKIISQGKPVNVTMKADYNFIASPTIFNYETFSKFPTRMPNATVPKTTWTASQRSTGTITLCFSQTVKNPVLMVASLGGGEGHVAVAFSVPFVVLYQSGRINFTGNKSMSGLEGNAVIMFQGEFTCVTIRSSDYEKSYITLGIPECPDIAVKPADIPEPVVARVPCPKINWTVWNSIAGMNASGKITGVEKGVGITIKSGVEFNSKPDIFSYQSFSKFPFRIPNTTVPGTKWTRSNGVTGTTSMCFSETVKNPVLMLSSVGGKDTGRSTLTFSEPYVIVYQNGNIQFPNSTSITGLEGYAIIMFPGNFKCVSVRSSNFERAYITWGIPECAEASPVKPVIKPLIAAVQPAKPTVAKIITPAKAVALPAPLQVVPATASKPANRYLQITLWDFDCVDFDSVSVTFNNKQVGPKVIQLPAYRRLFIPSVHTYRLDVLDGDNILEIHALNEGVNPFNSVAVFIIDDQSRRQLFYRLKAKESAVLHFSK